MRRRLFSFIILALLLAVCIAAALAAILSGCPAEALLVLSPDAVPILLLAFGGAAVSRILLYIKDRTHTGQ